MRFIVPFKYDREIGLRLSSFMAKVLPGTPFPDEVPFCLCPGEELFDAETHRLFMTLDSGDRRVQG